MQASPEALSLSPTPAVASWASAGAAAAAHTATVRHATGASPPRIAGRRRAGSPLRSTEKCPTARELARRLDEVNP